MASKIYTRFVEIGRVVLIQYGPDAGKLATIIDVVDQNRVLIDGPANLTGVKRQVINLKWVALTDLKLDARVKDGETTKRIKVARNARQKTLTAAWTALDIQNKWNASAWGKKLAAKATKAASTDFDRFKLKLSKQKTSAAVRKALKA